MTAIKTSKFGFRARLTALIAGVFILGIGAVIAVQLLLLRHLFEVEQTQPIRLWPGAATPIDPNQVEGWFDVSSQPLGSAPAIFLSPEQLLEVSDLQLRFRHLQELSNDAVMRDLLLWSVLVLVVCAGLAILVASWLSKRSLGRIAQITTTTQTLGVSDLHQRLNLTGPEDEIKDLGNTIDAMLARLQDAFERQDRFIAGASHELRTPLATTRAALEIPLQQGLFSPEVLPDIENALAANERGTQLVNALLTLARSRREVAAVTGESLEGVVSVESPALTEITDWSALVGALLAERRGAMKLAELNLEAEIPPAICVRADRDLLLLATSNLLDNAIKHNKPGGSISVVLRGLSHGGAVFEVSNDGADLTQTDLGHLMEPFNRGKDTRLSGEKQGLGLGLALVQSAATALGATFTLAAREPGGLTASLLI